MDLGHSGRCRVAFSRIKSRVSPYNRFL
jgi:hypothetical protein